MSATAPPRAATGGQDVREPPPPTTTPAAPVSAVSAAAMPLSIVELCGKHAGRYVVAQAVRASSVHVSSRLTPLLPLLHSCGYCKGGAESKRAATKRTSVSFGLSARRLLCQDYQALIDLGWRRSGEFIHAWAALHTMKDCRRP